MPGDRAVRRRAVAGGVVEHHSHLERLAAADVGRQATFSTDTSLCRSSGTGSTSMPTPASASARACSSASPMFSLPSVTMHDPLGRVLREHRQRPLHRPGQVGEVWVQQAFDPRHELHVEIDRRHFHFRIAAEDDHARPGPRWPRCAGRGSRR